MEIKSYKDLLVWQKAMQLVVDIYEITELFPKEERFGLTSQIQRAAISIPSNIAEGYRRNSRREYARFLSIAYGSAAELETQIEICKRLKKFLAFDFSKIEIACNEILRMLNVMNTKLTA